MYARFPPFFGQPGPSCGVRRSGFLACPAPDTAVPIRVRRRVEPAPAVMAMVVAGRWQIREARQHVCSVGAGRGTPAAGTGCWQTGMARSVPVRRDPGACLPDKAGVCLSGSREGSRMPIRVSAGPKAKERTNAGPPSAGCPACWDSVGQSTEPRRRFAGKGCLLRVRALCRACCPQKMKGAPKGSLPHQKLTLKNYPLFGRPP